jgi:site-specific recombinase XerD
MTTALVQRNPLTAGAAVVPASIADAGDRATARYIEFFTAGIRNPNARLAYACAASAFFAWCEGHRLALIDIEPVHVAAYIEVLGREGLSAPTVKQQLAAIRMLFDWLVVGQVVRTIPPRRCAARSTARPAARRSCPRARRPRR